MRRIRFAGVGELGLESADRPEIGLDEALVRIHRCGVCGTDLSMWQGTFSVPNLPLTPGHELSGEVVATGSAVDDVAEGTRVAIDINMTCNECFWCRKGENLLCPELVQVGIHTDGGMAEYLRVPASQLVLLPDSVSYDAAAAIEPIACVLHAQDRANIEIGESVAVIGSGIMGYLHAKIAQIRGASPVILVSKYEERLGVAREMGIEHLFLAQDTDVVEKIKDLTDGRGVDVAIEAAGAVSAYELAFEIVRRGGRIVAYGIPPAGEVIPVEPFKMFSQELSLIGAFVTNHGAWRTAVNLLASGELDVSPIQSALVSLDRVPDVPQMLREDSSLIKVLVDPAAESDTVISLQ